jgi:hypothetical protein
MAMRGLTVFIADIRNCTAATNSSKQRIHQDQDSFFTL